MCSTRWLTIEVVGTVGIAENPGSLGFLQLTNEVGYSYC